MTKAVLISPDLVMSPLLALIWSTDWPKHLCSVIKKVSGFFFFLSLFHKYLFCWWRISAFYFYMCVSPYIFVSLRTPLWSENAQLSLFWRELSWPGSWQDVYHLNRRLSAEKAATSIPSKKVVGGSGWRCGETEGWVHKGRDTEHHPALPCFTLGSWQQLCELQLHVLRNGVCSSWGAAKYLSSFLGNGWIHPAPWYFVSEGLESVGVLISLSYTIMLQFHMCWLNESSLSVFHSCCILGLFLLSASWVEKL